MKIKMHNLSLPFSYIFRYLSGEQVLAAANFADHKFEKKIDGVMALKGIGIGTKVQLVRKVAHPFGKKGQRKDSPKGFVTFIEGTAGGKVVVRFTEAVDDKEESADVAMHPDNVEKYTETSDDDKGADGEHASVQINSQVDKKIPVS